MLKLFTMVLWFSSERIAMQSIIIDSTQKNVSGDVKLKIYKGKC